MKRKPNGHYSCFVTRSSKFVILMLGVLVLAQNISFENLALYDRDEKGSEQNHHENVSIGIRSAEAQLDMDDTITSNVDNREIAIVSISSRYDPDLGSFHIFGELINNLDTHVKNVRFVATFYDAAGGIIGTASGRPYIDYLRPQEKSAFDIGAHGHVASDTLSFVYYKISKSWDSVEEPKPSLLDLDFRDIFIDPCGYYHFTGTITNNGRDPAKEIILSAAFSNDRHQITESAFTSLTSSDEKLPSGKSKGFELLVDGRTLPEFAYYSFNVQSAEYASRIEEKDDEENQSFDYGNGSPTTIGPISSLAPDIQQVTTTVMTVKTDSHSYGLGSNELKISGTIPQMSEEEWSSHPRSPLVRLQLMTASGSVQERATAAISKDGSFSANLDFLAEEGSEGDIHRVRADYKGVVAESNFFIRFGNSNDNNQTGLYEESSPRACRPANLIIERLNWMSDSNGYNATSTGVSFDDQALNYGDEKELRAGSTVTLSSTAENRMTKIQPVTTVIEVFDSNGSVVFLHFDSAMVYPNTEYETNVPWIPDSNGQYKIRSFAITGLDEPRVLSQALQVTVNVA